MADRTRESRAGEHQEWEQQRRRMEEEEAERKRRWEEEDRLRTDALSRMESERQEGDRLRKQALEEDERALQATAQRQREEAMRIAEQMRELQDGDQRRSQRPQSPTQQRPPSPEPSQMRSQDGGDGDAMSRESRRAKRLEAIQRAKTEMMRMESEIRTRRQNNSLRLSDRSFPGSTPGPLGVSTPGGARGGVGWKDVVGQTPQQAPQVNMNNTASSWRDVSRSTPLPPPPALARR